MRARLTGLSFFLIAVGVMACEAGKDEGSVSGTGANGSTGTGGFGTCNSCDLTTYHPCTNGVPGTPVECPKSCAPNKGCVECMPNEKTCVGNDVHQCNGDGSASTFVESCDVSMGLTCSQGQCLDACVVAEGAPSNVGCEFWAVDLDQQDGLNDPASEPWGVVLSNVGQSKANVTIAINTAAVGQPPSIMAIENLTVEPGTVLQKILPTRELDCGTKPNDYASPGTCLSSRAFRITTSAPLVVYQFNVFENAYSNDASLLLPTNALGQYYRVLGWGAGHPIPFPMFGLKPDRSYMTIVGTKPNTHVFVTPSWRIKGNPPVAATMPGGKIEVTIGPFDVLNLETADGTMQDDLKTIADLSGSLVTSDAPIAVFSGVESTGAPFWVDIPKPPGWEDGDSCCLDHLEEQMFPAESVGTHYVIARSPVRSSGFREPDVIRFVGVAETATCTTSLSAPFATFTIQPGEVKTTWTQDDFVADCDKPVIVGQILISNQYTTSYTGDPSLTIFPPVEQFRSDYVMLTPDSWDTNYVVVTAEVGGNVTLDGSDTKSCPTEPSGMVSGKAYQTRRCALNEGAHTLSGDKPFGIITYGYGTAGSYAVAGGADVKKIYVPPQ